MDIVSANARSVVLSFLNALNDEDFTTARDLCDDALSFIGVMGTRDGADNYFNDMKHMKFKYDVKKVFQDEEDVCVWYDIDMSGTIVSSCGWYALSDYKIKTIIVLFDPRTVIAAQQK